MVENFIKRVIFPAGKTEWRRQILLPLLIIAAAPLLVFEMAFFPGGKAKSAMDLAIVALAFLVMLGGFLVPFAYSLTHNVSDATLFLLYWREYCLCAFGFLVLIKYPR